jgi:hypothetical protein
MKADFSENNIGLLDTYSIKVHGTGLASEDLASTIKKDTVLTGTLTLNSGFTTSDIKVTMRGTDITSQCTITASGSTVTITTPAVTGKIEILVGETTIVGPTGAVLLDDVTGVTLGGGSYGAGGIMFGLQTNFAARTYVSHVDLLACKGATYSNPTEPITTGAIVIYRVDSSGKIMEELARVESSTSFVSEEPETSGSHIYRIPVEKTVTDIANLAIVLNPADTASAPTAAYAKGVSANLGKCYMGSVKTIGDTISFTNSSYHLPCVIYG